MVEENKKMWFLLHMHMVWPCYLWSHDIFFLEKNHDLWGYFFLREKPWSLRIWPNNCVKGHEFPLTEFIFFQSTTTANYYFILQKNAISALAHGVCAKYKELFLSADILAVYEINLTIHLPFCGVWYSGNKFTPFRNVGYLKMLSLAHSFAPIYFISTGKQVTIKKMIPCVRDPR